MSIFAAHPALVQGHQTLLLTGIAFGYSLFAMSTATSSRCSSEAVVFTQNIRIFYAVSLCHSFTAAARQLGITQSAVSQGIAALEKQLDLELFDRTRRPLALCPEGQLLRDLVARQMGEADTVIASYAHATSSRIRSESAWWSRWDAASPAVWCRKCL